MAGYVRPLSRQIVRDHIPLEQGLRLTNFRHDRGMFCRVRDHIPLEQGLRRRHLSRVDPNDP